MTIAKPRLRLSRRNLLLAGGATALTISWAGRGLGQVSTSGTLAQLAARSLPADVQVVVVTDRANSRWRRAGSSTVPPALSFRSLDRYTASGATDPARGGWWIIDEPALRAAHAGAVAGLSADSSAMIQATLDTAYALSRPVEDPAAYRVDRSVTVPPGVVWRRANLQAGRPGMNVVLISSGSQLLDFTIRGSGAISRRRGGPSEVNERAVYPAIDGLRGAVIQGRISHVTTGVHLQPLSPNGPNPTDCRIDVQLDDIVGMAGTSEGYGVLLSPADRCTVNVTARNIQRHAVYLSAGASYNTVTADVTDCFQDAVTIYSMANQAACTGNVLTVAARGVRVPDGQPTASNSTCFSIYGKANNNTAHVVAQAVGGSARTAAYAAALVSGLETPDGPFPQGNRLTVDASGVFSGPYAVLMTDAVDTQIQGGQLSAHGSAGAIGFTDTRSNRRSFASAGGVHGTAIDCGGANVAGIVVATERSRVDVSSDVRFTNVRTPVRDVTGHLRRQG